MDSSRSDASSPNDVTERYPVSLRVTPEQKRRLPRRGLLFAIGSLCLTVGISVAAWQLLKGEKHPSRAALPAVATTTTLAEVSTTTTTLPAETVVAPPETSTSVLTAEANVSSKPKPVARPRTYRAPVTSTTTIPVPSTTTTTLSPQQQWEAAHQKWCADVDRVAEYSSEHTDDSDFEWKVIQYDRGWYKYSHDPNYKVLSTKCGTMPDETPYGHGLAIVDYLPDGHENPYYTQAKANNY